MWSGIGKQERATRKQEVEKLVRREREMEEKQKKRRGRRRQQGGEVRAVSENGSSALSTPTQNSTPFTLIPLYIHTLPP